MRIYQVKPWNLLQLRYTKWYNYTYQTSLVIAMSNLIVESGINDQSAISREAIEHNFKLGNWFWVKEKRFDGEMIEWFGCVMKIGSNFLEIHEPHTTYDSYRTKRVHFSDAYKTLRYESEAASVIQQKVAHYQSQSIGLMQKIQELTMRLGVDLRPSLGHQEAGGGTEIMVLSNAISIDDHKTALIKAKEVELPNLFKELKEANASVARWMGSMVMPQTAAMEEMKSSVGVLDDRIFNVSLYAGLAEDCILCADGEPAPFGEKLRVMQRRLYMDEESLLDYRTGGMEFSSLSEYDAWLAKPNNRDRILPFPRCIVAMQVRRKTKERENSRTIGEALARLGREFNDELTYLFIRNGEKIYRLATEVDFDEMIFPDSYDASAPLMVKMFAGKLSETITRNDYDERTKKYASDKEMCEQWYRDNPQSAWEAKPGNEHRLYHWANPYRGFERFKPSEWAPFDPSNVYFDDCAKVFAKRAKHFNYVALIIQGLFDRSEVLHPHPKVESWKPESFAENIELIYDATRALVYGEAPDFEAYRARCNALFRDGSISSGQQIYWEIKEAEKECKRLDANWREKDTWRPKRFQPAGNPGMGNVTSVAQWNPVSKTAKFVWFRDRLRDSGRFDQSSKLETSITIPAEHLFNISAYKQGDYLQFFLDPRTRENYLKWAPLLMEAEDYVRQNP